MTQWFKVGKVVNTHGIKGEVRVIASTDFSDERFQIGSHLYWANSLNDKDRVELIVHGHRKHKQFDLLTFEGYENVNDVEKFKGGLLLITEEQQTELAENEYYYHQIIGSLVETEQGEQIGEVKEILSPGANDVWVVKRKNKSDLLLPYIEDVVKKVDVENKVITVHLIAGLDES